MGLIDQLEWIGSLSGLVGAFLLATHTRVSRYGWLAFLAANLAMIGFAVGMYTFVYFVEHPCNIRRDRPINNIFVFINIFHPL